MLNIPRPDREIRYAPLHRRHHHNHIHIHHCMFGIVFIRRFEVSGYEFWSLVWYTHNPFKFGWYSYLQDTFGYGEVRLNRYPNGGAHLGYPGRVIGHDGPLSTIRLQQMRQGIEDYEILVAPARLVESNADLRFEIQPIFDRVQKMVAASRCRRLPLHRHPA